MNRNENSRFSHLPGVEIQRSKFHRPHSHKTTFDAGKLIPIFCDEVLPGDTYTLDMSSLVRMSTPVFPVMDNAFLDVMFFYCPNRLLWNHWKEFNGENSQGYWTQQVEYSVPKLAAPDGGWDTGSLADYFGIPIGVPGISVNALPFRCYTLIWNEWFRSENTMSPALFTKDDNNMTGVKKSASNTNFASTLRSAVKGGAPLPVSKFFDYFTSCLPEPQRGPAVTFPLFDDKLPVTTSALDNETVGSAPLKFVNRIPHGGTGAYSVNAVANDPYGDFFAVGSTGGSYDQLSSFNLTPSNLSVDVSNVAVATISQLRQAFQLQRLYEKDARGGTRYTEILKSHFGVDSPDARQQRPEYLGGKRIPINVDQVLQTSSTNDISPQGNTAAFSLTSDVSDTFTKSFTEHGWIIGVCCVRTDHTYQQGIERMWSRSSRFDYYWPSLAHISEQPVLVKEIFAQGSNNDSDAFGYQEAWADYRYKPSRVSGKFRSNAVGGSLDSWHYADYYSGSNSEFVLNADWLCETDVNIARTLAVKDSNDDQFIADFYFSLDCVRAMPLYSVPGYIDHF